MTSKDQQRIFAARRRKALKRAASLADMDAMLVTTEKDVGYLTGFEGEGGWLLLRPKKPLLIANRLYAEEAARVLGLEHHVATQPMSKTLAALLKETPAKKLGVQADQMTLQIRQILKKALRGVKLTPVTGLTGPLRQIKDDWEVKQTIRAIRIAEKAFRELIQSGKKGFIGRTERELAAELDWRMRCLGATEPSFATIVAAGTHSSRPHHRPGSRRIRADQAVLFDWGARAGDYCSDLTRVVFTGRIPPKIKTIYEVVRRAQEAGIGAIRSGRSFAAADNAARDVTAEAGLADKFIHSLGHGLGRDIHEAPAVSSQNDGRFRSGMIVTVEPGVYLPGVGGVRIEDDVLVTAEGVRRLSRLSRRLKDMQLH